MNYYFYLLCLWGWGSAHVEVIGHLWIWVLAFHLVCDKGSLVQYCICQTNCNQPLSCLYVPSPSWGTGMADAEATAAAFKCEFWGPTLR